MSAQLDALQAANTALIAEVARNTAVDESAIVLLNGLSAQLIAAKDDPVAIQAIADSMGSKTNELGVSSNALAASIIANTPAA